MPKTKGCVKTFKVKDKNNKLMFSLMDDDKPLEKYKAIWSTIQDLKNIELNALPVYNRYIKVRIRAYDDKVYINFRGLNVPKDH